MTDAALAQRVRRFPVSLSRVAQGHWRAYNPGPSVLEPLWLRLVAVPILCQVEQLFIAAPPWKQTPLYGPGCLPLYGYHFAGIDLRYFPEGRRWPSKTFFHAMFTGAEPGGGALMTKAYGER